MAERGGTRRTDAAKAGALSSARQSLRRQGPQLSGTNLERAGDHNQRVTLQAIRVNGPITRNGGLVVDGQYFRGANGRSGELGWLPGRDESGSLRQLQKIVSLSALYSRLAAQGHRVSSPRELTRLGAQAAAIVDAWIEISAETLLDTLIAVNCLINPEAVLIGGRLPAPLVDRLAELLNQRLQAHARSFPAIAPVARAATSEDAPAVGAAILPLSHRLLPTRFALMKTAGVA